MTTTSTEKITRADVRMYRMGTGDCFIIKLFAGETEKCKIMIDCGTWQGAKDDLIPYITDLKKHVGDTIDLLIVTHEHKDHVYVFEACEELFVNNFKIKSIWMAWTESDDDEKAQQWLKDFGDKKKALKKAANKMNKALKDPEFVNQFKDEKSGDGLKAARGFFADALNSFADLQFSLKDGDYVGMLKGMKVVKQQITEINKIKIRYCHPGEIISNLPGAEGIRFYVLGPPLAWEQVKKESGGAGESYAHNNELAHSDAFAMAVLAENKQDFKNLLPFDMKYVSKDGEDQRQCYEDKANQWRNIDHDWLNSAGALALRVNSMTNNLSLALAMEFEDSGRVMLFPGDAEYGSWESWHNIPWPQKDFTKDLLNRTVFYKVAHHLSHNGTAQRLGMEMMDHPDLAAMATLDYGIISNGWKSTMPNKALIDELLKRTKGRLMVMNENNIPYDKTSKQPLSNVILNARANMTEKERTDFDKSFVPEKLYLEYKVNGLSKKDVKARKKRK